jgi:catechol 2,3-dioxygenase-like lactoylglutathione lyase family enzyme
MPVYNHVGLVVSDLERSKRFYEQVLGFRVWYEDAPVDAATAKLLGLTPPLGVKTCYLTLGECFLELIYFSAPEAKVTRRRRTMDEVGQSHLSISVDDIRSTAARAVECGGDIVESSDLGLALLIRDPDGQLLELLSMNYPKSRPPQP